MNAPMLLDQWLLAAASMATVNFDKAEVGKPPSGWTATQWHTLRVDECAACSGDPIDGRMIDA